MNEKRLIKKDKNLIFFDNLNFFPSIVPTTHKILRDKDSLCSHTLYFLYVSLKNERKTIFGNPNQTVESHQGR